MLLSLLMEPSKISFHLIAEQYKDGKPMFFKNIDHLKKILCSILESSFMLFVDMDFYMKKSLRMYDCSHRSEPKRKMYLYENGKKVNIPVLNSLEKSLGWLGLEILAAL